MREKISSLIAEDRTRFLEILSAVVARYGWICYAYCLMTNHYHLLIETPDANLSRGIHRLNGVYTQWFNRQHGLVEHLLQGDQPEGESSAETGSAHHAESVCAKMVRSARDWLWGSYRAMSGRAEVSGFLAVDWVLSQFDPDRARAVRAYYCFVRQGLQTLDSRLFDCLRETG